MRSNDVCCGSCFAPIHVAFTSANIGSFTSRSLFCTGVFDLQVEQVGPWTRSMDRQRNHVRGDIVYQRCFSFYESQRWKGSLCCRNTWFWSMLWLSKKCHRKTRKISKTAIQQQWSTRRVAQHYCVVDLWELFLAVLQHEQRCGNPTLYSSATRKNRPRWHTTIESQLEKRFKKKKHGDSGEWFAKFIASRKRHQSVFSWSIGMERPRR